MDLRCGSKKHGVLLDPNIVEVKCDSRFCGAAPGVVILHRFNSVTAELMETVKYKNPERKD